MVSLFRKLISKSKLLDSALGGVIYESSGVSGEYKNAYIKVRLKEKLGKDGYLIGFKMRPEMWAGTDGATTDYIHFDVKRAKQLRDELDTCIANHERLENNRARAARPR